MKYKFGMCLYILIHLLILFALPCFADNSFTINLKMQPMSINDNRFYIKEVLDGRIDKNNIGTVKLGLFNKKTPAYLSSDFVSSIQSYLDTSFTNEPEKIPIAIKIIELRISERSQMNGEFSRAEAKIEFYKISEEKLGKLFETEAFVEKRSFSDVTVYHEENLRNVIEKCFKSFSDSNWVTSNPQWEDPLIVEQRSVEKSVFSIEVPDIRRIYLVEPFYGSNGKGTRISKYEYELSKTEWQRMASWCYYQYANIHDNSEVYHSSFGPTYGNYKRFGNSNWGALLEWGFQVGFDQVRVGRNGASRFIAGARLKESIMLIPKNKSGFVCSLGTYQIININSEVYPWDAGITASVGLQF